MKTLSLVIVAIFFSLSVFSQEDTTKIRMGDKKILIIDKNDGESKKKLQSGKMEFEAEIAEIDTKIHKLEEKKKETDNAEKIAAIEKEISDLNMERAAIEQGIADIDQQLADNETEEKLEDNSDWDWDLEGDNKCDKMDGHWAGFEFGLNNYFNKDMGTKLPADGEFMDLNTNKSWEFNLNIIEYTIPLIKTNFGIVTGLGFQWNGYNLKQNITLIEDADGKITPQDAPAGIEFDKNKLRSTYLTAPLIFETQVPIGHKGKRFHLGVGVIGGLKIGSSMKLVYEKDGETRKEKNRGDYQLSPFRYGVTARIGYRAIRLFANYNITPLFENGYGPELYPYTIGITILDF